MVLQYIWSNILISYVHLDLKLERQATLLSTSLNLPIQIAKDALARAIYCEADYKSLESSLYENFNSLKSKHAMFHHWLKFLLIGEGVNDKRLIVDLRKSIDHMANRLTNIVVVNISRLQLISKIFILFGLEEDAKYINTFNVSLKWLPIFNVLNREDDALQSTIILGDVSFRLIAIRYFEVKYDQFAVNKNFKRSLLYSPQNEEELLSEANRVELLKLWFLSTHSVLNSQPMFKEENRPHVVNIKNKNYLVYGFPLNNKLCEHLDDSFPKLDIKVRNVSDKQMIILKFGKQKLTLEAKKLDDSYVIDHINYCEWTLSIKESLLTHIDARRTPVPINNSLFSLSLRPYRDSDLPIV